MNASHLNMRGLRLNRQGSLALQQNDVYIPGYEIIRRDDVYIPGYEIILDI